MLRTHEPIPEDLRDVEKGLSRAPLDLGLHPSTPCTRHLQHGAFRLQSSRARALPPPYPCVLLFGRAHIAFPRPHFLFGAKRRGREDARRQRRMRDRYVPA